MNTVLRYSFFRLIVYTLFVFVSIAQARPQSADNSLMPHEHGKRDQLLVKHQGFRKRLFLRFEEKSQEPKRADADKKALSGYRQKNNNLTEGISVVKGEIHTEWIRQYASNLFPSDDYANAVSISPDRDIYVTGVSITTFTDADYLTVKYNTNGDTIWTKRFNGRGNGYDEATTIGVDSAGNIYVSGLSSEEGNKISAVTIKYDPLGNVVWERRLPDPYDSITVPTVSQLSPEGDIYITGYVFRNMHAFDIFLAKYSPEGDLAWIQYYDGVTNDIDIATSISVREANTLVIGGYSRRQESGYDALVLWFSKDGSLLWLDRYSGEGVGDDYFTTVSLGKDGKVVAAGAGFQAVSRYDMLIIQYNPAGEKDWTVLRNGQADRDDKITQVQVDDSSNIFLTGYVTTIIEKENIETLRYDSTGTLQWSSIFDGPKNLSDAGTAIVIDQEYKKVYVTGYSNNSREGDDDLVTIKYDYDGKINWIAKYASPADGDDLPSAIALDRLGDLVVTGWSSDVGSTNDFLTIKYINFEADHWPVWYSSGKGPNSLNALQSDKSGSVYAFGADTGQFILSKYDSAGSRYWIKYFGNGRCTGGSMLLDDENNILIVGSTIGDGNNMDGILKKYDTDGNELWSVTYDGSASGDDYLVDIGLDSLGYIYVVGTSYGESTSSDYITIKYDKDGNELWNARFNGSYNYRDSAVGIVVTPSGDVVVTGTGIRRNSSYDYLTIKYSTEGDMIWSEYYNGTGNGADFARAIDLDKDGNVYVTGRSYGFFTLTDYATIKYSPDGQVLWVARFDAFGNSVDDPSDILIDDEGNTYVTGVGVSTSAGYDIFTVKYNSIGSQMWKSRFNGMGNGNDYSGKLALDQKGNVYLIGTSYGDGTGFDIITIKLNPLSGMQIWNFSYDYLASNDDIGTSLLLDEFNSIYIGGNSTDVTAQQGIVIAKFTTTGVADQLWSARLEGPGMSFDDARLILTDDNGNLFIGGTSADPLTDADFRFIEYLPDGTLIEELGYSSPYAYNDELRAMVRDRSGNIYLAGTIYGRVIPCNYGIVKYSSGGIKEWEHFYNGESNSYDFVSAMAMDDSGNAILTGFSAGALSYNFATVKYSPLGDVRWVATYDAPGGGDDLAYAAATDKDGNILIAGLSYWGGSNSDYTTVKYSPQGTQLWARRYAGEGGYDDRIVDIHTDNSNNVYVTGWSVGRDSTYDIVTIKYDGQGELQWEKPYSGPPRTNQFAVAMSISRTGKIFVTGRQLNQGSSKADIITFSYDTSGNELWTDTHDGPGYGDDIPASIVADDESSVYVTGKTWGLDNTFDFLTIKYDSIGEMKWQATYSALRGSDDEAADIVLDINGNPVVTGTSRGNNWSIISTVKYSRLETGVVEEMHSLPDKITLEQNYPNPFNAGTIIRYHIPSVPGLSAQRVHLKLYNLLGQDVETIVDQVQTPGDYEVHLSPVGLPSGFYFYRLTTSFGYSLGKKMLLIR